MRVRVRVRVAVRRTAALGLVTTHVCRNALGPTVLFRGGVCLSFVHDGSCRADPCHATIHVVGT